MGSRVRSTRKKPKVFKWTKCMEDFVHGQLEPHVRTHAAIVRIQREGPNGLSWSVMDCQTARQPGRWPVLQRLVLRAWVVAGELEVAAFQWLGRGSRPQHR